MTNLTSIFVYWATDNHSWRDIVWKVWHCWYVQDLIVFTLLLSLIVGGYRLARRSYWQRAMRQLFKRRGVCVAFGILCLYVLIGLLDSVGYHPFIRDDQGTIRHDAQGVPQVSTKGLSLLDCLLSDLREHTETSYSAPFAERGLTKTTAVTETGQIVRDYAALKYPKQHWFGTDKVGLDVLYVSLKSIRTGLIIGIFATLVVIPFALSMGILAGYLGGWVDDLIQFIYTVLSSIPSILLIVAYMAMIRKPDLFHLCFIMSVISWTGLCRTIRGETLKVREMEFVQAATAMGTSRLRIMWSHIAPNVMHLALISAVLGFSARVKAETVLTYLGIGVGPNTYSWGSMINMALGEFSRDPVIWWNLTAAFVFMLGLVLCANLFGDALRDALDPRLRSE